MASLVSSDSSGGNTNSIRRPRRCASTAASVGDTYDSHVTAAKCPTSVNAAPTLSLEKETNFIELDSSLRMNERQNHYLAIEDRRTSC